MKTIDTFPFNGDWILKMRLDHMSPCIDEFVITESWYTYSGKKKDFLYRDRWEDVWRPYASKIHWIILDEKPECTEEWWESYKGKGIQDDHRQAVFSEHYQRDLAVSYIQEKYHDESYIVHVGDVDEIPSTEVFHPEARKGIYFKLNEMGGPLYLEMLYFYYNFYWRKPYNWYRAYLLNDKHLRKNPSLSHWRAAVMPNYVLKKAGWHLCYFMDIAAIKERIHSLPSGNEKWADDHHIKECIAQGRDLFDREGNEHLLHHEETLALPSVIASYQGELDYIQMS